ncbi:acyl carrier protein [Clostridium sp.]|uniref:acyl carrier protein n=1 Tax=Clostridium sp. TaxID=1506 RepID=UPI003D6D59CE
MNEKLKEIVAGYAEVSINTINGDSRLIGDLGLGSMDFIDLVVDLEETFDVEINDKELWSIQTFGDLETYITNHTLIVLTMPQV